jgi:hypothetical protein
MLIFYAGVLSQREQIIDASFLDPLLKISINK